MLLKKVTLLCLSVWCLLTWRVVKTRSINFWLSVLVLLFCFVFYTHPSSSTLLFFS